MQVIYKDGRKEFRETLVGLDLRNVEEVKGIGRTHTARLLGGS